MEGSPPAFGCDDGCSRVRWPHVQTPGPLPRRRPHRDERETASRSGNRQRRRTRLSHSRPSATGEAVGARDVPVPPLVVQSSHCGFSRRPSTLQAAGGVRVEGIGPALLPAVTEVAEVLNSDVIWGEATRESAPKYERFFHLENVRGLFVVSRLRYQSFATEFLTRSAQTRLLLR